jgi:hypothetical protein
MNKNPIEIAFALRAWVTYNFALHLRARDHPHYMILEVCWDGLFTHFLLGSHNFTVTALGLCVKWPLDNNKEQANARWM